MEFLLKIANIIDKLNEGVGRFVSWMSAFLVVVVFSDVVLRYAFNISFVFTQELEWQVFAFIFLIGAGYTLLHDGHVRVDIVYQKVSPKAQAWINLIGCLVFMAPGCYLVISTSLPFVYDSWKVLEGSPDPGGIPFRFIIKGCIPVGFVLFGLQGVSLFIRSLNTVLGRDEARGES
ncbi:MAG: TRAP transporter small permease subunit [Deltaproteobacteria bacterium]|nr:TRAP transporter small permease subunit [Deltaproteobacteria bacterium]